MKHKIFFKTYFLNILMGFISGCFGATLVGLFIVGFVLNNQNETVNYNISEGSGSTSGTFQDQWLQSQDFGQEEQIASITQETLVVNAVKKTNPAVVSVIISKDVPVLEKYYENSPSPFRDFFGNDFFGGLQFQIPQYREKGVEQKEVGGGSGFFISSDGLIVTNKHVVSDTNAEFQVFSTTNKEYKVTNIYRDPTLDIAILKVDGLDINPLPLGDSSNLKVGQSVIAIGTALGEFRNTVTTGVVSGLGRGITAGDQMGYSTEQLDNVIQTDAAINPGNSGGPLLNSAGQVIGVNVATAGNAENISFAIPINVIKEALDNFDRTGKFDRAFLGVQYKMISRDLSVMNEIPEGAYIVIVVDNSPASKAGLQKGDIIQKMDGQTVTDINGGLAKLISQHKIGDQVKVDYWRDGKTQTTTITLGQSNQ